MAAAAASPFRVLVVDDNPDVANSAALLLKTVGFEVLTRYDGSSALASVIEFRPNVCIVDLNMPGMDGDEFARRLQPIANWQPLLLVAVTAMNDDASCQRIKAAGFHMQMLKPADPYKLVGVVDALFRLGEPNAAVAEVIQRPSCNSGSTRLQS